jgi:hypothetical protein
MRIVASHAGKASTGAASFVPVPVATPVDAQSPVSVLRSVAFRAEQFALVIGNLLAYMIDKELTVLRVMAVAAVLVVAVLQVDYTVFRNQFALAIWT